MSFIFISYSSKDKAYVRELVHSLTLNKLPFWLDENVDYGARWSRVIQSKLEECHVIFLVMSPRSYASDWVHNELLHAKKCNKPIYPLLLEGESWMDVASIQYVDVQGGKLPPDSFFASVGQYLSGNSSSIEVVTTDEKVITTSMGEEKVIGFQDTEAKKEKIDGDGDIRETDLYNQPQNPEQKSDTQNKHSVTEQPTISVTTSKDSIDLIVASACDDRLLQEDGTLRDSNKNYGLPVTRRELILLPIILATAFATYLYYTQPSNRVIDEVSSSTKLLTSEEVSLPLEDSGSVFAHKSSENSEISRADTTSPDFVETWTLPEKNAAFTKDASSDVSEEEGTVTASAFVDRDFDSVSEETSKDSHTDTAQDKSSSEAFFALYRDFSNIISIFISSKLFWSIVINTCAFSALSTWIPKLLEIDNLGLTIFAASVFSTLNSLSNTLLNTLNIPFAIVYPFAIFGNAFLAALFAFLTPGIRLRVGIASALVWGLCIASLNGFEITLLHFL
jgi:hypothetical protein